MYADQFQIYHGNANPDLARKICRYLGMEPGPVNVFQFANENIFVQILDNVREKDVFIVQPTSSPVNQSIMELLIMIDAFKRASAGRITAVIPYYAYGRSDKKDQPRVPITARLVADMISVAGADRVLTMDLHQGQIQGFFNIPVDELTAVHILSNYFKHKHLEDLVVVTDLGFAKRARTFAELLDAPLAIIEKRRVGNLDRADVLKVIGEVRGKRAIIVDDEVDTAGTLIETVNALRDEGVDRDLRLRDPRRAVRGGRPADRGVGAPGARAHRHRAPAGGKRVPKITTLSIAPLIGEAIKRIHRGESVGALFSSEVEFTQEMLLWEDGVARKLDIRVKPGEGEDGPSAEPMADLSELDGGRHGGRGAMSLQLHRPDERGVLKPEPGEPPDYREQLRSPRWGLALRGGRLPAMKNPEMRPTSRFIAVMFWVSLAVAHVRAARRRLRPRNLAVPDLIVRGFDPERGPRLGQALPRRRARRPHAGAPRRARRRARGTRAGRRSSGASARRARVLADRRSRPGAPRCARSPWPPDARGQGIGRVLIDAAAAALRRVGRPPGLARDDERQPGGPRALRRPAGACPRSVRRHRRVAPHDQAVDLRVGEHGVPIRDELELELVL